jgi:oligopeptidase B
MAGDRSSMRLTSVLILGLAWLTWIQPLAAQVDPRAAEPPVAKKLPKAMTIHGDTRVDDYFWLREKKNPEVTAYLEAENAYTTAVMKPLAPFQEALYREMLGRIQETDTSAPYHDGEWYYYTRTEKGKQYPIHCRKYKTLDAREEILLELNEMAKGHKFLSLSAFAVGDDGNLLAYSIDTTGFREYTLAIKDLRKGTDLTDKIAHVQSVAWAADNRTLFYVKEDAAKRPYRLYRHRLGQAEDDLVYEEKDELYRLFVRRSHDKKYLFASSQSSTTTETRYALADKPMDGWTVVLPRENEHEYHVDHRDGLFYIRTNKGAKNFRIVTVPAGPSKPDQWKEMVAHDPNVFIEGLDLFAKHAVISERENGLPERRVIELGSGKGRRIRFPEPAYSLLADQNPEFDTNIFRFRYQSLVTPESVFDYNMDAGERRLVKQTPVLGGFDPGRYVSERIFATTTDGTHVPISLVYRKGTPRDGSAACVLYGYGAYGFSLPITFASDRLSLLDRGVIFAMAHIRGGSDMGRTWHDRGKMMAKRNTFTDFIACADHLVAQKYANRDRLVIYGGSAGGLLIGAVLNFRPDLCRAAILRVPFVDVINTMLDASLPLTVQEYLEWGNPNVRSEYDYIKSYCPYTNIAAKDYPALLVLTSFNDSQVMYWEPAKYVAKMRATRTDSHPLLFRCNMSAGHGGASGRYDALKENAFMCTFILGELGIRQ